MIIQIGIVVFYILCSIVGIFLIVAFFTRVPFLPTPQRVADQMIRVGNIGKGDVVADLGCGDARVLIEVAKKGARAIGWELNPLLVLLAWWNIKRAGVSDRVRVYWGDYQRSNLQNVNVVFLFLIKSHMSKVEQKLLRELKKKSKVFSYIFPLSASKPSKVTPTGIYYYIM